MEKNNLENLNDIQIDQIKKEFHDEMVSIYKEAKSEVNYNATRFLQMISDENGFVAARKLISKDGGSDGFTKLWDKGRLDISVEAKVLKSRYSSIFTEEEISICKKRLKEYGYTDF